MIERILPFTLVYKLYWKKIKFKLKMMWHDTWTGQIVKANNRVKGTGDNRYGKRNLNRHEKEFRHESRTNSSHLMPMDQKALKTRI